MLEQLFGLSNYRYNPHAIPVMVVSILIFSIGLFILFQAKKLIKNVAFFLLCASLSLWLFTTGFVYFSDNPQTALLWYKYFTFFGVVSIMPSAYLFSVASSGRLKEQRNFVIGVFLLSYIFYLLALTTDKFITSPELYFWGYYPHYKPLNLFFLFFYLTLFVAIQANLWLAYKREKIAIKKTQVLTIIIGFMIGFIASVDYIAKVWTVPIYPFGFAPMFIFTSLLAYSIIRHKAFDIETVIHKTALWILSFSFIIIPIFFIYRWFFPYIRKTTTLQFGFWMVSFLSLVFYIRVIQPRIDHFFQRRKYNLEDISSRFVEDLIHLKGINKLSQRIEDAIAETLYPQRIDIFIYNEDKRNYKLVNLVDKSKEVVELEGENSFLQWLSKNDKIAYRKFIDIDPAYAPVREKAKDYFGLTEAIVAIPLVLNEKLLGIINLGKKASLRRYSAADFHFLTTLKNQSSIAISNSLLYENIEEQVRQRTQKLVEVQKQLIQAEKLATVGTLAGGVAHEINNPLTAILTNVQMLLTTANSFDTDSKESLELIEEASKRCRTIVQKLMTYAKKPLESSEVSEIDLLNVVKKVVSFLGYQLEQENIEIISEVKENAYPVYGNHNELEQIVTNIVLNARDAIKRIKKSGAIYISLSKSGDWIKIKIKDEGVGMPKKVIPRIFDPFFTTKEVGKGVGLGLSICQAIVEKHNGLIKVQSEPDKGSIFTVQLPMYAGGSKGGLKNGKEYFGD